MGNEVYPHEKIKSTYQKNTIESINRSSFDFLHLIGYGGFSKVWKVKWKKNDRIFALKEMSKARILDRKCVKTVLIERELLSKMNHPFIVNMHFSFQDRNSLYLVMDLITGKDLRYHLCRSKRFTEEQTKFLLQGTILALEYIHANGIIHRDIKPENIVLDASNGYIKLTDFGIARKIGVEEKVKESSGTPGYMAPEVMCMENNNVSVDYYSLGIMGYEFMKGIRPYISDTNKNLKKMVLENQVVIKKHELPEGWSIEAADFINRLIQRRPSSRLGYHGAKEVKEHIWFRGFQWGEMYMFNLESPFYKKENNEDMKDKAIKYNQLIDSETMKRYKKIMNSKEYKTAFSSYLFFNLYDKNLSHERFNNPHEVYEKEMIKKIREVNEGEDNANNVNTVNNEGKEEKNKKDFVSSYNHINKGRSALLTLDKGFSGFNNFFNKSQNIAFDNKNINVKKNDDGANNNNENINNNIIQKKSEIDIINYNNIDKNNNKYEAIKENIINNNMDIKNINIDKNNNINENINDNINENIII